MSEPVVHDRQGVDRHEAETHLDAILRSPAFRGSKRCHDFLRYVVTETLNGHGDSLKERSIAVSVFERGPDYEPAVDSIVRVKANEVRKRLSRYYEANPDCPLQIVLSPGTYVPQLRKAAVPTLAVELATANEVSSLPVTPEPSYLPRWAGWTTVLVVLIGALFAAYATTRFASPASRNLDRLWQPLITGPGEHVLLCLPSPHVSENQVDGNVRSMEHYYVGVGAAHGAALFGSILGARKQAFQVKFGSDVSFADLRRQPAILLGGFSSYWGVELTKALRFRLRVVNPGVAAAILDSEDSSRIWHGDTTRGGSKEILQDFALVSRILDSGSGKPVLTAAGLTAYGTQAATEFLSDEALISEFVSQLGPGWESRNFQVVLRCDVRGFTAGKPKVVASHVW